MAIFRTELYYYYYYFQEDVSVKKHETILGFFS
jgi:hypothetical protein